VHEISAILSDPDDGASAVRADSGGRSWDTRSTLEAAMSESDRTRRYERQAPAHTVQVTAEHEGALSLGEAVDLSAGGARVVLQSRALSVGDEVILWLSFARPRQPVPATGRVVWAAGGWDEPHYGLEWTHEGPQRSWIGWATSA
jgi:hypothetical protein